MIKSVPFANAVTIVTAIFYVVCVTLSYIAPDFIMGITQSWIHTLNLEVLKANVNLSLVQVIYGLVTLSVVTWVTTYASIELYNRLAKSK